MESNRQLVPLPRSEAARVDRSKALVYEMARTLAPSAAHADRMVASLRDEKTLPMMLRRIQDALLFNRWP